METRARLFNFPFIVIWAVNLVWRSALTCRLLPDIEGISAVHVDDEVDSMRGNKRGTLAVQADRKQTRREGERERDVLDGSFSGQVAALLALRALTPLKSSITLNRNVYRARVRRFIRRLTAESFCDCGSERDYRSIRISILSQLRRKRRTEYDERKGVAT